MVQDVIAEYKVGKAVYQVTERGFVDNINPRLPDVEIVYPWEQIYASLEYETLPDPVTGRPNPVMRWLRVYLKGGKMIAEMPIADDIRGHMVQYYQYFKSTQNRMLGRPNEDEDE